MGSPLCTHVFCLYTPQCHDILGGDPGAAGKGTAHYEYTLLSPEWEPDESVTCSMRVGDLFTNCKLALLTSRSLQGKDKVLLVQGIDLGSRHVAGIQERLS